MAISIHNNASSLVAQRHLSRTNKSLAKNLDRLSSGLRINSAADESAGLAISADMNKSMRSIMQAKRNANDGISVLQTAEGSLGQMTEILTRMKELSVQANSDILTDDQRDNLDQEFSQLQTEINNLATTTDFNGISLLDGTATGAGAIDIQVGDDVTDLISLDFTDMQAATLGIDAGSIDLSNAGDPAAAQTAIDTAMNDILAERAKLGGLQNRLETAVENLANTYENLGASHGRIVDVDVASEMASFTKNQVLMQAGSSMLAQANSQPQNALSLLG